MSASTISVPSGRSAAVIRAMNVWARVAIISGLLGLIVSNTFLPPWLQGTLLGLFVLAGPGAALCSWAPLPAGISGLVAPSAGVVGVVLFSILAVKFVGWDPLLSLAVASILVFAAGMARTVTDARRVASLPPEVAPVASGVPQIASPDKRSRHEV